MKLPWHVPFFGPLSNLNHALEQIPEIVRKKNNRQVRRRTSIWIPRPRNWFVGDLTARIISPILHKAGTLWIWVTLIHQVYWTWTFPFHAIRYTFHLISPRSGNEETGIYVLCFHRFNRRAWLSYAPLYVFVSAMAAISRCDLDGVFYFTYLASRRYFA